VPRAHADYLRAIGKPLKIEGPDRERVLARVRSFRARGMTLAQMDQQTGVSYKTIHHALKSERRATNAQILARLARLQFEEPLPNAWVDSTGAIRRLKALWAAGYSLPWLAEQTGFCSRSYLQLMFRGVRSESGMEYQNVRAVARLYERCAYTDPVDLGVPAKSAAYARTFAAKKGYAPPGCWDEDTIDDPDALPEWTGACGTERGYQIHYRERIPYCPPCSRAHHEYKVEHPGKSPLKEQRWAEVRRLSEQRGMTVEQIAHELDISERTVIRALKEETA
jgi:AraC-like DNA-binding protein